MMMRYIEVTDEYIKQLEQENKQLKSNFYKLKAYFQLKDLNGYEKLYVEDILNYIEEIEKEVNENEFMD